MAVTQNPVIHPADSEEDRSGEGAGGIRLRIVILGFFLSMAICLLTPFNNAYRQATPLGGGHFPLAPFFILIVLTPAVALFRKVFGRSLLTGKELLIIWVMTVLVSGIAYTGLVRTFFVNLTVPWHFATVENRWDEQLQPMLPKSWYPHDPEAVSRLYNGLPGGRSMTWWQIVTRIPWSVWITPLAVWSVFIGLCYMVMICLVNLLSRQWIHNERMNFPLLQVPRLIEDALDRKTGGRMFFNHFLLAGCLLPICLHTINGFHEYYPTVPQIPTLILAGPYFPEYGLFSGFYKLKIYIYPMFVGFAFMASRQISFSFWLFFILGGLLIGGLEILGYKIPAAALGITFGPTLSRPEETQMIGAYSVFFLFIVWLARHHLIDVVRQAIGLDKSTRMQTEWFSLRLSFWGFVMGSCAIIVWCRYFGMPMKAALLMTGAFFMVMVVASRVICQGGIAYFTLTAAPMDGLLAFFGTRLFTPMGIVVAAVTQKVLFVDLRESLMPSLVHSRKIAQDTGSRRLVFAAIVLVIMAGVVVSFIAMLCLCYRFGIRELDLDWAIRTTTTVYDNIQSLANTPVDPGRWVMVFSWVGALVMSVLVLCYQRFYWWPIHPIGYLMTYSSAMRILWFSFLVGWLCNALCMRYGGIALFRRMRYFFAGLIIGDVLMAGVWAIAGLFTGVSYQVLPT